MTYIPRQYNFEGMSDDVVMLTLLKLPYKDIINACVVNKRLAKICDDRVFWSRKALNDFRIPIERFNVRKGNPREIYLQFEKLYKLDILFIMIYNLAKDLRNNVPAIAELETQNITNVTHESIGKFSIY